MEWVCQGFLHSSGPAPSEADSHRYIAKSPDIFPHRGLMWTSAPTLGGIVPRMHFPSFTQTVMK